MEDTESLNIKLEGAILQENLSDVERLVNDGASVNDIPKRGLSTPLSSACYQSNLDIVTFLLSRGAEVNPISTKKFSIPPLLAVCNSEHKKNNVEIAQLLISFGADVNCKANFDGSTPLHSACFTYNIDLIRFLLSAGADVDSVKQNGETPLHSACGERANEDVAMLLLNSGAVVDARDNFNQTPLHYAAHHGCTSIIDVLYDYRANLGAKDNDGKTPLHVACVRHSLSTVETLLDKRSDIRSIPDNFGNLPIPPCTLVEACERGYTNIVLWHLSLGGIKDINQGINSDNNTLLHIASKAGNLRLVNNLLGLGAYPMSRNGEGKTPLQVAREHNHNDSHSGVIDLLSSLYSEDDFPPVDHAHIGGATRKNKKKTKSSNKKKSRGNKKRCIQNVHG
uniref:Uncharacterized protein n=1 Tax=viral metagenome TaxID=1070528 RepID=A0A6C0I6D6_9ZZZZ